DSCGIAALVLDVDTFSCADVGAPVTVTLTVSDLYGNAGIGTAQVTVLDTVAPVIQAHNDTFYLDINGLTSIVPADIDSNSFDSCGLASLTIDTANFSCLNVGTPLTVTLTGTDNNGNTDTAQATVTILDTIAPVVLAQSLTVYLDGSGQASIVPADVDSGSWDSCGIASLVLDSANFDCANAFSPVTVTLTVTDIHGNSDSAQATITVLDTALPVITCPAPIAVDNDANTCGAEVGFAFPTALDNCLIDSIVQIDQTGLDSGAIFPIGTTTLQYVAYDPSGNTDTCSFTVTVTDTTAPTISCPGDTVICDPVLNYALPTASDNCTVDSLILISGLPSGASFPVGTTVNTFVAYDPSGLTDTCSFTVTRDALPTPADAGLDTILCNADSIVLAGNVPAVGAGLWTVVNGPASLSNPAANNALATGLTEGVNQFAWTTSNGVCPSSADTVTVSVDGISSLADAGPDQNLCETGNTFLEASLPASGVGTWSLLGGDAIVNDPNDPIASVSFSLGEHILLWTVVNGVCPATTDTVIIRDNIIPTVDAGVDLSVFGGFMAQLEATVTNADSILWTPATGLNNASIANPIAQPLVSTTYTVEVSSAEGCSASDEVFIDVEDISAIPTAITPDGDGVNDFWIIEPLVNYPNAVVKVYNRLQTEVYSSIGYDQPWDGKYNGNDLPVGSYYFVIDLQDGINSAFTGTVTIIR
ncbi:MAG: HYR domain-containing protein, partial [Bacteroidota bacterium]